MNSLYNKLFENFVLAESDQHDFYLWLCEVEVRDKIPQQKTSIYKKFYCSIPAQSYESLVNLKKIRLKIKEVKLHHPVNSCVLGELKFQAFNHATRVLLGLHFQDESLTLEVTNRILENGGFAVKYFKNLDQVIQLVKNKAIDIVLISQRFWCEYNHQKLNGIQISKLLKTHHETKNIPIIIMFYRNIVIADCQNFFESNQADGYIILPIFNHQKFYDIINQTLEHSKFK